MKNASIVLFIALCASACGDSSGSDAGPDSGPIVLTCASYCDRIDSACAGAQAQFPDIATCMSTCATMPEGTLTDTAGNTLGCRIYHVGEVEELGDEHCLHAGPAGGTDEGCGTTCESFCNIVAAACTGANQQFADDATCMSACAGMMDTVEFTSNETTGDTLACRLYHATFASRSSIDAEEHCPHVAVVSETCVP